MSIEITNLKQAERVAIAIQMATLVIPEGESLLITNVHSTEELRIEPVAENPDTEWRVRTDGRIRFRQRSVSDGEWTVLETSTHS